MMSGAPSIGCPARFESLDERFGRTDGDAFLERLFGDGRWLEGPAYFPAGRYLVFSDIPNDRMLRWDETTGAVGALRQPAGYANGHTVDRAGRLISCEQGNRRVTRTEHDGSHHRARRPLPRQAVQQPQRRGRAGRRLDLVHRPELRHQHRLRGPPGRARDRRLPRLPGRPASGEVRIVADDFERPNGLAFSADEQTLYIADTRRKHIRRFNVADGDNLTGGEVFATCDAGSFDGLRVDAKGRVWAAAHDGLHCFAPDGTLLGKLLVPEIVSNLTFGGPQLNHLFITATTSLYTLRVNFNGARYPR